MRHYKFKIGELNCVSLEEGNATIPIVKEFSEEKHQSVLAAHKEHGSKLDTVEIGFNYLLLQCDGKNVLIDCGKGQGVLVANLEEIGIAPSDIDYLIITHGDGDHIGGLHHFEHAKIVMAQNAYDIWMDDARREQLKQGAFDALVRIFPADKISGSNSGKENFAKEVIPSLGERLILVKNEEEFLPGIKMFATPGHREDHYAIEIKSGAHTLVCLADAIRHGFQLKYPELSSLYDSYDKDWSSSISIIKRRDVDKEFVYFGTHVAFPGLLSYDANGHLVAVKKHSGS